MADALEIDFLPVGENSKSGDAIAFRFGNYENSQWKNQTVFIIDGGNKASGEALITHVNQVYKTDKVDRVILTHPDGDHASGLRSVVDNLDVGKIWMHRPWNHWADLKDSIKDGRITKASFGERLRNAYQYAYEIEQIAVRKKIEIFAPHQGAYYHEGDDVPLLRVLGPGKELYLNLLQASDKTPQMGVSEGIAKSFSEAEEVTAWEDMNFDNEHLGETPDDTSVENDMSLVLYLTVANQKILFTGDAGILGMYNAIRYSIGKEINLKDLNAFQVPHHGSKHNLSKGILDYIYAPIGIISCAKLGEPVHYSKIVSNALRRRKIVPYKTQGTLLRYHGGKAPDRAGFSTATPIPFHNVVEL
ncbi:MAG: MBL fold metallo-hydrolase [Bacteroidetes bacterium]|nr:MBL fold metallo-hydrolase [Bacteroidota bacterium]